MLAVAPESLPGRLPDLLPDVAPVVVLTASPRCGRWTRATTVCARSPR